MRNPAASVKRLAMPRRFIAKRATFAAVGRKRGAIPLTRSDPEAGRRELGAQLPNLAGDLGQVKNAEAKARIVGFVLQADEEYGTRLAKAVGVNPGAARASLAVR